MTNTDAKIMREAFPQSRQAYFFWNIRPSEKARQALRKAIVSEGGVIEGNAVIAWARENLL